MPFAACTLVCQSATGALITTEIGRYSGLLGLLVKLVSPFTKNPDQGAATTVYCAARAAASSSARRSTLVRWSCIR